MFTRRIPVRGMNSIPKERKYHQQKEWCNCSSTTLQQHSVLALIMAIWRRLGGIQSQDAYIAFKHVHQGFYPHRQFVPADWTNYSLTVKRLARDHYPFAMAIKMLLKPIPLVTPVRKMVEWPLVGIAMLFTRA